MTVWLVVDGPTKSVRIVRRRPRPSHGFPYSYGPHGPRLKPTEVAFEVNVVMPGAWGTVQSPKLEVNLPTPAEVGITTSPVVSARST